MDPDGFEDTHAAVTHDFSKKDHIIMHWASNYHRLVCQVMFTLFFAGEIYAPKCQVNGKNVGLYLQECYLNAVEHFARRVNEIDQLKDTVIGWESMNEPGHGLVGYDDITTLPTCPHHVKLGTAPNPYEAMRLGRGVPTTVERYTFTITGPRRLGSVHIAPKRTAWLSADKLAALDKKYGWVRSWKGDCIWRLHGVYDDHRVLKKNYFAYDASGKPLTEQSFINEIFITHWQRYFQMITRISDSWFVFMQCPVNNPPPDLGKRF
jgi:hypothetical protein